MGRDRTGDRLDHLASALPVVGAHIAARSVLLWVYVVLPYPWKSLSWGDLGLYEQWAGEILATGAAPAGDTWMYPPGAVPVVLAPTALPLPYDLAFICLLAVLDALVLALLLGRGRHPAAAWTWALLPPLLGPLTWARLDLVPVAATAAALLWLDRRPRLGGAAAAFGTAVKAWPVLLGTVALRERRWLAWAVGTGLAAAAAATVALDGAWDFVARLTGRGIQVESVLATPWLLGQATGGDAPGDYANGTFEVIAPGTAELAALSPALVAAGVAAAWWASRGHHPAVRWWAMALALLATSPLLSTQFILWAIGATAVAAAVPGAGGRLARRLLPAVAVVVALSHLGFPVQWGGLTGDGALAAATVSARNLLLLAVTVAVVVSLARRRPPPGPVTASAATPPAGRPRPATSAPPAPTPAPAGPTPARDRVR
ncbi:MAG: glycosyltransferase 87 family protein [Kineosporiaceae bacterium]